MKSILIRVFLPILVHIGSPAFRRRAVELIPLEGVQSMRHISDVLYERSVRIFAEKKAALANGDEALKHDIDEGQDIMSILRAWCMTFASLPSDVVRYPQSEKMSWLPMRTDFPMTS